EEKRFSIDDVLDRLSNKLVDRHPHVFGDVKADTPGDVLRNWQALKAEEKKKRQNESGENGKKEDHPESVLAGVSSAMPSLMEAYKISSRVAAVGFDWPNIEDLFEKLDEETKELRENLEEYPAPGPRPESAAAGIAGARGLKISPELRSRLEDEVGDLLFVLVNIARYLSLDPESALRKTNRKFRRRFEYLEEKLRQQGRKPSGASLNEMESLWQESKQQEKA
ncbi:MAG: MazG nucleotide pyrophosphohydrolase domain-containing protein, partial [Candidatus Korobacteraceae bacterium]